MAQQANPPCSEREEASWHTLTCPPLWDAEGNVYGGSFQAYYKQIPDVLTRRGPHNQASDMHKYARASPGIAFYFMPEKRFPQAARKAAQAYPGDKTSVTELASWLLGAIEGPPIQDRDEVAKLLIHGKGSMKLRRFLHLTGDDCVPPSPSAAMGEMSLDASSGGASDDWEEVAEDDQMDASNGEGEGEEAHDEEYKAKMQAAAAERKRGIDKCLEQYNEAEKAARREEEQRKDEAAEQAKAQAFYDGLRRQLARKEYEVTGHGRTNAEQQYCTLPLLDYLQRAGVHKTHDILAEHMIVSPHADWPTAVKADLVLLAKEHGRHEDVLIECKTHDWLKALGQCRTYVKWWKHPDGRPSQPNIYAYFPEPQPQGLVDYFGRDPNWIGVLWPGCEQNINLNFGM